MPNFEEVNGIQHGAGIKLLLYGQEGVGKTSLAAQLPGAVFIDCEGSTTMMNVRRLPKPTSWQMLCDEMEFILQSYAEKGYKTAVIDTFDWAERLCIDALCAEHKVNGIEGFGYGKGWQYEAEKIGRFLDMTERLISAGIHVALLCHAITKKTTLPEEMEEFDHWELKLGSKTTNKIAPLLKEWSDMTLFLAFHTNVIATDSMGKKHKATSAERVMYTTKTAWWDAKNRFGLPERLPLDFGSIAHLFVPVAEQMLDKAKAQGIPVQEQAASPADFEQIYPPKEERVQGIPDELADRMEQYNVSAANVEFVSSELWHYFPGGMKLQEYPADYHAYLLQNWETFLQAVQTQCPDYIPFI